MEIQKWILDRHQHSGVMYNTRSNFFLLAQSMTLVSFATIYKKCNTSFELAICGLGYAFVLMWVFLAVRDNKNNRNYYPTYSEVSCGEESVDKIYKSLLRSSQAKYRGRGGLLPLPPLMLWSFFICYTLISECGISIICSVAIGLILILLYIFSAGLALSLASKAKNDSP
jgi:hypothetical protein